MDDWKNNIKYTEIYRINKLLVVADSIESAIKLYKNKYEFPYNEINTIERITTSGTDAIILKQ